MKFSIALKQHHALRYGPSAMVAALLELDPPATNKVRVVVQAFCDVRAIQHYLGHRSIASTARYTALGSGKIDHQLPGVPASGVSLTSGRPPPEV